MAGSCIPTVELGRSLPQRRKYLVGIDPLTVVEFSHALLDVSAKLLASLQQMQGGG